MIHTIGNNNCIGVEVPEGKVMDGVIIADQLIWRKDNHQFHDPIQLPPGSYAFLFLYPDGVTEEGAREVVERWDSGKYTDYTRHLARVDTAVESLRTLFQSLNIHDKNIAVCKGR